MSFKLLCKYFDGKFDQQNKIMVSKIHSDARQIEKKLKFSKPEREIDLKFKGNEIQHEFNVKLVEELGSISFLVSEGSVSYVKEKIHKLAEEVQRRNKLINLLIDHLLVGLQSDDLASDLEDEK